MASGGSRVAQVELPDGSVVIYAQVTPIGGTDVSVRDKLRLDQADEMLRRLGRWALDAVRTALPGRPDEFELEFGMKLGVKGGSAFGSSRRRLGRLVSGSNNIFEARSVTIISPPCAAEAVHFG